MSASARLLAYLAKEQADKNYVVGLNAVDYKVLVWEFVEHYLLLLANAPITDAEHRHLGQHWQTITAQTYQKLALDSLATSHPSVLAKVIVLKVISHRIQTLPYYAKPNLSLLHSPQSLQPKEFQTDCEDLEPGLANRQAFWLGWGVR